MDIEAPFRRHPRLHNFDYNENNVYFITFCTRDKAKLLSAVVGRDDLGTPSAFVELSSIGAVVEKYINSIHEHNREVIVDTYVIMPNHVHILLSVDGRTDGAPGSSRPTQIIPRVIAAVKRFTNREAKMKLWQVSYYDHIIRDAKDYETKYNYIETNPARWAEDEYYPRP